MFNLLYKYKLFKEESDFSIIFLDKMKMLERMYDRRLSGYRMAEDEIIE